jgi:dTDP-4-amino-4,6-dideoxygalactose transaminase
MSSPTTKQSNEPFLPFSAPSFGQEERKELLEALDSGWITTGPRTKRFEEAFAAFVGAREAVAVNSCTAALHLALAALRIGTGDAVITSPFTFAATANVVVHQGAYPVFVDIDPNTYNLDVTKLRSFLKVQCSWDAEKHLLSLKRNGRRVRAIIPVHYGGNPCEMDRILRLAGRYGLAVIEDAAHAAGASYRERSRIGALSTATCFSFYANKNMTTAEGGMLTTNDPEFAQRVRVLSSHGISKDSWARYSKEGSWQYDLIDAGFKYNLTDLASALGLHQLKKLDGFIARRAQLAERYSKAFAEVPGLQLPIFPSDCVSAWHLYPVQITAPTTNRNDVINHLRSCNIGSSVHFIPLHLMTFYQHIYGYKRGDFPIAESVFDRIVSLPLFPKMKEEDVDRVVAEVSSAVGTEVSCHYYRKSA